MLSILTLNVALFTITIFGFPVYSFQSHPRERFAQLVDLLSDGENDIVLLQEMTPYWQKQIVGLVSDIYPYYTHYQTHNIVSSETMILSKFPISNAVFQPFQLTTGFEAAGVSKGILSADITLDASEVTIINTHLVASGFAQNSINPEVEKYRESQINQIINYTERLLKQNPNKLVVVGGDFNSGPEASQLNYKQLREYYADIYMQVNSKKKDTGNDYTWSSSADDNMLSRIFFKDAVNQRIDMFYIPKKQISLVDKFVGVSIVPNEFSDHRGVQMEVVID